MDTYNIFLEYYDKIVRNTNNAIEEEIDFLVEDCIKKYKPGTKHILETACGTGIIASELHKKGFCVIGLDISKKMLQKAEKNIDKKNLILGDMTDFDLNAQFDIVLCNYNSICHLLKWEQWQDFFDMSYKHLKKDGLLVFDINTIQEFESITRDFAQFYNSGNDVVCMEMFKKQDYYEWLIKIFKEEQKGKYKLIKEVVKENSFLVSKIKKELKSKGFEIIEVIDYHYGEVSDNSERVYFICKKI